MAGEQLFSKFVIKGGGKTFTEQSTILIFRQKPIRLIVVNAAVIETYTVKKCTNRSRCAHGIYSLTMILKKNAKYRLFDFIQVKAKAGNTGIGIGLCHRKHLIHYGSESPCRIQNNSLNNFAKVICVFRVTHHEIVDGAVLQTELLRVCLDDFQNVLFLEIILGMQTGKLFVRDRNARAIFCIGFFAAQHPIKDVLSCTENRLIVHHIGDNGSLTMEIDRSQTCRDADGTSRDFARAINIYNSLFAKNSDGSTSSFNNALWKQLSISIYSGTKYPEQVLSLALLRSCRLLQQNKKGKENRITASLAGITKAFLIRNYGENMTMGLNSNNTSPAYITGRIFAHMESAQRKIDPNNQTTYAKRFFERVMMNPAKTMPELHKSFLLLKNKAKANGMRGLYNSSDKKIMALIDMLDGNYPDHLSEKQKGEYLVGYYQQRSANIKDAEEKKNRKAAKIETNNTDTATTVATQKEK